MQTNAPFVREGVLELPMRARAGQDFDIGMGGPGIQSIGQWLMLQIANIVSAVLVEPVYEQTETIARLRRSGHQAGKRLLDVAGAEEQLVDRLVGVGLGEAFVSSREDTGYEFRALDESFEEDRPMESFQRVL
jgi:hypothetical protein